MTMSNEEIEQASSAAPAESAPARDIWAELRRPFPPEVVGKLPRVTCTDCRDNRGSCSAHRREKCSECDAWISPKHVHLAFVGHATVTDRLLSVDPTWNWEPLATDEHGLPFFERDQKGNPVRFWIKLTVGGVTRLGVGDVASGAGDPEKVLIGDAIRNAALRFGVALDLWAKDGLESHLDGTEVSAAPTSPAPQARSRPTPVPTRHQDVPEPAPAPTEPQGASPGSDSGDIASDPTPGPVELLSAPGDEDGWAALGWSSAEAHAKALATVQMRIDGAYSDDPDIATVMADLPTDGMAITREAMQRLAYLASHIQVRTLTSQQISADHVLSDSVAVDIMRGVLHPEPAPATMAEVTPTHAKRFVVALADEGKKRPTADVEDDSMKAAS